jgi:transcriptional regulator with XRE-family HTH domain
MPVPDAPVYRVAMKFTWLRFAQAERYRGGTRLERRILELQITAATAVREHRKRNRLRQKQLAERLGTTQARISHLERAQRGAALDLYVHAMIVMGATDDEIANALNPPTCRAVRELRRRAGLPAFPLPMDERGLPHGNPKYLSSVL